MEYPFTGWVIWMFQQLSCPFHHLLACVVTGSSWSVKMVTAESFLWNNSPTEKIGLQNLIGFANMNSEKYSILLAKLLLKSTSCHNVIEVILYILNPPLRESLRYFKCLDCYHSQPPGRRLIDLESFLQHGDGQEQSKEELASGTRRTRNPPPTDQLVSSHRTLISASVNLILRTKSKEELWQILQHPLNSFPAEYLRMNVHEYTVKVYLNGHGVLLHTLYMLDLSVSACLWYCLQRHPMTEFLRSAEIFQ